MEKKYIRHILLTVLLLCMTISIVAAFYFAPPEERLGESARLLYVHVPLAFSAVFAFILSGVYAALFLLHGKAKAAYAYHNAVKLGMLFTVLTTVTGAFWAHTAWGVWWNWDPRETSIIFLLAVYIAYFAFHASMQGSPGAEKYGAAYLLFAAAVMPFFVFIAPRIYPSLHPDTLINPQLKLKLSGSMRFALFSSMISFGLLTYVLFDMSNRVSALLIKKEVNK